MTAAVRPLTNMKCGCIEDHGKPSVMFAQQLSPWLPTLLATLVWAPRELKFALESFWEGKSSDADLEALAKDLRASIWKQMADAGITLIPSNTFSYYDQVLDTTALVGAVPPFMDGPGVTLGLMSLLLYGLCHFIVPELGPATRFSYSSRKAVNEYKEGKEAEKSAPKDFDLLSLPDSILPVYNEVIGELTEAGAKWVQLDEPSLVLDLEASQLEAFKKAYSFLGADLGGLKLLLETYFSDIPAAAYK
ncbi:unnamed protein product [Sphagnum troendelagicum]|uniref:Cobalamin-independent methionine synthase MetE N-terminal domain-containing protein n=1 Tax=Sphagnum troendelagicum TaxID=128251 RepID=A0ABP0UJ34_9BRYO